MQRTKSRCNALLSAWAGMGAILQFEIYRLVQMINGAEDGGRICGRNGVRIAEKFVYSWIHSWMEIPQPIDRGIPRQEEGGGN